MLDNDSKIQGFSIFLRSQGKSGATIESYCRDSRQFLEYLEKNGRPLHEVSTTILFHYKEALSYKEKENSVRRKIISIRQFYRYLKLKGFINDTPFDDVPIPARNESISFAIIGSKIDSILDSYLKEACSNLKMARDAALLHLIAREGLKATELIALHWTNFHDHSGTAQLSVGGIKPRTIELGKDSAQALRAYKSLHYRQCGSSELQVSLKVFVGFKGKDCSMVLPALTRHGLKFALYEIGEKHDIPHLNAEGLRHFAIHSKLEQGLSTDEVARHLGLRQSGNIAKHLGYIMRHKPAPVSAPAQTDIQIHQMD
jgi:integrase/recombinase XerD